MAGDKVRWRQMKATAQRRRRRRIYIDNRIIKTDLAVEKMAEMVLKG